MTLQRIGTRFLLAEGSDVDPASLIPVFQRWIQQRQLPGLLIDVADYSHVLHGPGIMLVGHEGDLSVDFAGGRPGVVYMRKREHAAKLADGLATCARQCLLATEQLQRETELPGLKVDLRETEVIIADRLRAPNGEDSYKALRGDLAMFAFRLYGDAELALVSQDPRENLRVAVRANGEQSLAEMLRRMAALTLA